MPSLRLGIRRIVRGLIQSALFVDIQLTKALLSEVRVAVLRVLAMMSFTLRAVDGMIPSAGTSPALVDVSLRGAAIIDRQRA